MIVSGQMASWDLSDEYVGTRSRVIMKLPAEEFPQATKMGAARRPFHKEFVTATNRVLGFMAGTTGLEPATSAVTGQRSDQLSYVPRLFFNNLVIVT
jgi:hypothetical protein